MMMKFVFVGPEVEENEVGCAAFMNTKEADVIMANVCREIGKALHDDALSCRDQLGAWQRARVSDAIDFDLPILDAPELEEPDWPRLVRSHLQGVRGNVANKMSGQAPRCTSDFKISSP